MERLGYQRYAAQGGDWGALIVDVMGVHAPSGLVGIHTNLAKILDAHGGMNRWNKYQKVKRSHPDAVRVAAAAIRNP